MSDKSKNVKIFVVLMIIVGILLIGLLVDYYVYYEDVMDEYSELRDDYNYFDEPVPEEINISHNVDRLYFTLGMISFTAQIIFAFLFAFFTNSACKAGVVLTLNTPLNCKSSCS